MAKPRIPLPKQVEKVHRDRKSQYDRRQAVQVSLEGTSEWIVDCPTCGEFIQVQRTEPTICPKCQEPDINTKSLR
ncbi:MAG: hypothetical protein IMZ61_11590 [Planctomycetes bacterium]|nr:hypothetical protein [Planctomycetota bacterium]